MAWCEIAGGGFGRPFHFGNHFYRALRNLIGKATLIGFLRETDDENEA
jgi:hypothetical protein